MQSRTRLTALVAGVVAVVVLAVVGLVLVTRPAPTTAPTPPVSVVPPTPFPTPTLTASPTLAPPTTLPPPPPPPPPVTPQPCGTFDPRCSRLPISGATDAYTTQVSCGPLGPCSLDLDIVYPQKPGSQPWPVLLAIPGGPAAPGIRHGLGPFASLVAGQGAVVFVADYREAPQFGGGYPITYQDIGCAIRFARANAAKYGGDPSRITLVAHSLGGFFGSTVALSSDPFTPAPGQCVTKTGSTKPDAFIGIAGIYTQSDVTTTFLNSFFGATASAAPQRWAAGNPYALAAAKSNHGLPIQLIQGTVDTNVRPVIAENFQAALQANGYDSTLTMIPGADHNSVLQNPQTVEAIMQWVTALGGQTAPAASAAPSPSPVSPSSAAP